jgi:hypothetical protein
VTALYNVFVGALLLAGTLSVLTFIAWLAVQWLGNWNYLFGEGGKYDKRDSD